MNSKKQMVKSKVYDGMFGLVSEELEKCDMSLPCSTKSFQAAIGTAPCMVDLKPLLVLEGKDFVDALWMAFFQKLPDDQKRKRLEQCEKEEILKAAAGEGTFAIRGLKPVNSPYGPIKTGMKGKIFKIASNVKNSIFLRKLAKKLPDRIQKRIRELFC